VLINTKLLLMIIIDN